MKRIKIPRRLGHELDADADDCLAYVSWAGIAAHIGRPERGRNILWVEDSDFEPALALLRSHDFEMKTVGA
jgi:type III secretory pathway lipoprotein EscJ